MNEYELIGRLADLDSRLKKLECVEPIQEQSTPIPLLIEAVDKLMEAMPKRIDGCCSTVLNNAINNYHLALATEKKRSELVKKVIARTRCFINFGGVHCGLAGVEIAIKDLDTFDKEAAK